MKNIGHLERGDIKKKQHNMIYLKKNKNKG